MAVQPIISKPVQRPPVMQTPQTPLWVPLMMVFVTALAVAALGLSIVKNAPAAAVQTPSAAQLNIKNADTAPVEEGKEMAVKINELERGLMAARADVQRLTEELLAVRSSVDGLNANVA